MLLVFAGSRLQLLSTRPLRYAISSAHGMAPLVLLLNGSLRSIVHECLGMPWKEH